VKISWHPRWKAEGALGPYRVSPALMMVIPQQNDVTLRYGPNRVDAAGRALSVAAILLIGISFARARRPAAAERPLLPLRIRLALFAEAPPTRRWGGLIPAAVLAVLFGVRLVPERPNLTRASEAADLSARAQAAQSQHRFADAAEYAQHAIARTPPGDSKDALRCLRGEALAQEGRTSEARRLFDDVLRESPNGPSAARARTGLAALGRGTP
jgi:tetratricopeptide (TPR) repeat protein